jgi:hypothetical protein
LETLVSDGMEEEAHLDNQKNINANPEIRLLFDPFYKKTMQSFDIGQSN